jgi:hypothetical protein
MCRGMHLLVCEWRPWTHRAVLCCAACCLQVIAFCLYSAPLYYMAEKLLGVHTKPMHLKLLARLPVCEYTCDALATCSVTRGGAVAAAKRLPRAEQCPLAMFLSALSRLSHPYQYGWNCRPGLGFSKLCLTAVIQSSTNSKLNCPNRQPPMIHHASATA